VYFWWFITQIFLYLGELQASEKKKQHT